MKYCTKCGNKLTENAKFCTKCGSPTKIGDLQIKKIIKEKNEKKKENSLLYLGVALIILASLIFAFAGWEEMSDTFRVLFLTFEMLLFLSLSIFGKRFENNLPYKTLWFVGLLFIPIIIHLIGSYGLFGKYLSYEGAGIYVYLSISFLLCSVINEISYKLLKSKIFLYTTYIYIYITLINILNLIGLKEITSQKIDITITVLCCINLIIIILNNYIKKNSLNRSINVFMTLILFIFGTLLSVKLSISNIFCYNAFLNNILIIITSILTLISFLILMKKDNRCILSYTYPIFMLFILINMISLINNSNVSLLLIVLCSILIYFVNSLYNNKGYRIISLILFVFTSYIAVCNAGYKLMLIISILQSITLALSSKLNDGKFEYYVCSLLSPINIVIISLSVLKILNIFKTPTLFIISSLICFAICIIIKQKSNKKFIKILLEIFSYLYMLISSITILFSDVSITIFIINEISWVYYFIYKNVNDKNKPLSIVLFILLLFNLSICSFKFNTPLYYILLFISGLNIAIYLIILRFKNIGSKFYFYTAFIVSLILSLFNLNNYSLISICINILIYVTIYRISIKNIKINFILKYIYTIIGFILIYDLFNYFINIKQIVYIFTLISYIIIITSMFLLQIDSDRKVLSYTPIISFPYLNLVYSVDTFKNIQIELIVLLSVILILIFFERVFKFSKENDRITIELLLLGFISLFTIQDTIIFNFILSVFYIFYGLYKKKDAFVFYGIILLILSVIINLYNIIDDLVITYILLFLGIVLIIYVFYKEAKRNIK